MSKLLSLLLALSIIVTSSLVVFADSETEASGADPEVPVTEITQEQLDQEVYRLAENLVSVNSLNAAAATHDVNDVYNLLYNYLTYAASGSGSSYLKLTFDYVSGINSKIDAMRTTLSGIYTQLGENSVTTIWDNINDIFHALTKQIALDGNIVDITASDLLLMIDNNIDTVNDSLNTIMQSLAQLQGLASNIANTSLNIATNTSNTVSAINSLNNDFNLVIGTFINNSYLGFKTDLANDYTTGSFNYNNYPVGYFAFNGFHQSGNYIYCFAFPVRGNGSQVNNFIDKVSFVNNSGTELSGDYFIDYDYTRNLVLVYLYNSIPFYSATPFYVKVNFSQNYNISTSSSAGITYFKSDNIDFYIMYQYLTNFRHNKTLSKFEYLYASDDLIKAKQDQQPYEDQAITDFTGSGSAAASGSDLGNLKDVSGNLKSGLNSGASVSNALSIFNSNSSFWGWFSQSNYDNINSLSGESNNRSLRSSDSTDEIIDFYSENRNDLLSIIGGDR